MATLKDIAEKAGVSVGTVDRILHNRGRFAPETAETVRRLADEMDYRPNLMARHLSRSSECRIGFFLPESHQDSGYWALPLAGARRAERELAALGVSLEAIHYDRYSPVSFRSAGERLLTGRFDGILMAPLQDEEARSLLARLDEHRPVVFFDTDLPGSGRMSCIGQDSYQSGRLAARLLSLAAGERQGRASEGDALASWLAVAPDAENEHLDNRLRGFRDRMEAPVKLCRVRVESDHDRTAFEEALDLCIGAGTRGLFVADASTHYVAEYLSERGRRDLPLAGYDLVPENRRWLEAGVIDFLLTQRPGEQGYAGVNKLFRKIFHGEDAADHIFTPIDIVVPENLQYLTSEEVG